MVQAAPRRHLCGAASLSAHRARAELVLLSACSIARARLEVVRVHTAHSKLAVLQTEQAARAKLAIKLCT